RTCSRHSSASCAGTLRPSSTACRATCWSAVRSPTWAAAPIRRSRCGAIVTPSRHSASTASARCTSRWQPPSSSRRRSRKARSFLELKEVAVFSDAPELVGRFIRLVESDQGYTLYKAVSDAKEALSSEAATRFTFRAAGFEIDVAVTRAEFESWIAPELEAIE